MTAVDEAVRLGKEEIAKKVAAIQGPVSYQETAYHLPVSYALTGREVHDAASVAGVFALTDGNPLVGTEMIVAAGQEKGAGADPRYAGFIPDAVIRKLGYSLVDGSILGLALVVGTPPSPDKAPALCRELQEKLMLTFLAGGVIDSLTGAGVRVGLEYRLVPLGQTVDRAIHFVDILARVAMMFGGVAPGDSSRLISYASERAKAFVLVYPGLTEEEVACISALSVLSVPILSLSSGYEGGGWREVPSKDAVKTGMDIRGIRVQVTAIPIPMSCSPAFEGKAIRKEDMYVEFGGGRSPAFELLRMRPAEDVEDGRVTVIGPEVDQMKAGSAVPLGVLVEVSGKNMKKDFEPVLERRIHNFVNYGEGSWHVAQRDLIWVRLTKEAVMQGVRMVHIGQMIAAKFRMDFPTLIDACQVTIITDASTVIEEKKTAELVYSERDDRIRGMRDEDVDTFYSCTLCQTFAPNHVCIITPERPALCGAITWLDGRTAYEMSPSGANQPVEKGALIDRKRGEYEGINRFVRKASHGEVDRCALYSIMESPMTCCGCFEAIALILPEVNGVMVVSREFKGETPSGMTFSTLAGTIGGGAQTPGFIGISKTYLLSDRFLEAEGGISRVVWMPSVLKEEVSVRLREKLEKTGKSDLLDKIADEISAPALEDLVTFLTANNHPALIMEPLI